ncbi:MAG: Peptidase protease [Holophagaceae bacterium]|nr:Peptidase protease [Holophagaceae bacterium]
MKDFFKSLFASLIALGLFVGIGVVFLFGLLAVVGASSKPTVPSRAVLVFDLSTNIPDAPREEGAGEILRKAMRDQDADGTPLAVLIAALDRAAKDRNISALYLTGNIQAVGYGAGPAALKELREAIQRFKAESGKPVLAYNQTWSKKEYYLCAGAGTLYANPFGVVEMSGPSAEMVFLAGAFKKYGVEVQVTRVGKYKSAVEPFILDKMSDANREQYQKLLDDVWTDWKGTVAKDRGRTEAFIQSLADEKALLTAPEAQQAGLVDKLAPYDEVLDQLKTLSGKGPQDQDFPQIDLVAYSKIPHPAKGKHLIGVVYAEGEIVDGEGQGNQVGGDRLSQEIRRLRLDSHIKAIVLRVNSPGGSATASEVIQRELVLARKTKPVVVSMGTVAASGGYWISAYGDRIFAEPATITGSIGVFGMLPNVRKLATDHGVSFDGVQTAKLAMPSLFRPASPTELARIQGLVDHIYDQFLTKVAEGRHMKREQVQEIAQGRVWSGIEAKRLGLVDELGGLQDAIRWAAKKAQIESDYRVDAPESPRSPVEKLLKLIGGGEGRPLARGPVLELKSQLERQLGTLQALNDPFGVYARLPLDVTYR